MFKRRLLCSENKLVGYKRKVFRFNDYNRDTFIKDVAAKLKPGSKVLDVGAGSCLYKSLFSHCDYKSQDFAKYEGDEHAYGELDYICDINSIPVESGTIDLLLCTEVLEHIPYPIDTIKRLSNLLKVDGKVVITAPLASGIHMAPYHYYGGFTPYWYKKVLTDYGFNDIEVIPNEGFFKSYAQESQRFLTILEPKSKKYKKIFFPLKVLLAIYFRLIVPVICHFLENHIKEYDFTVGYFVIARKNS